MTGQQHYFQMTLDAIDRFEAADSDAALAREMSAVIARFGFQHFCFVSTGGVDRKFPEKLLMSVWPKDWLDQYTFGNFYRDDPIARWAPASIDAFRWSDMHFADDERAETVMTVAARDFRMRQGYVVPIHSLQGYIASASLAGDEVLDAQEAYSAVELITMYAFNCFNKRRQRPPRSLTSREREVVSWIAAGKSAWDTGGILHIAEDTVNKHIKSAMRKLDVHTRAQAVAKSIRRGEIAI